MIFFKHVFLRVKTHYLAEESAEKENKKETAENQAAQPNVQIKVEANEEKVCIIFVISVKYTVCCVSLFF